MRRKRKNRKIILIYVLLVIFFVLGLFSTIFALINSTNSNIINNVRINNINVSGLTKYEAEEKLINKINAIMNDQIILKHKEHETTITPKQIELNTHVQDKVYEACTIGRNNNIIVNNYKILKTTLFGEDLNFDFTFNEEIMRKYI